MTNGKFHFVLMVVCASLLPVVRQDGPRVVSNAPRSIAARFPLAFEANVGQARDGVRFLARAQGLFTRTRPR